MLTSQREFWNGQPEELRELFSLTKGNAGARCALWSHQLGWELRLTVNGSLVRSQVTRQHEEAIQTADQWLAAMQGEGWIESTDAPDNI